MTPWKAGFVEKAIRKFRLRAAAAYAKYQKISVKSAGRLLVTGW